MKIIFCFGVFSLVFVKKKKLGGLLDLGFVVMKLLCT